jgi:coenzyme F420-reducing hydrogenase beta subunit
VQADAGLVYRAVRCLLKAGRKVLFSGTPCQVAGFYAVLGNAASADLITVDIVCHGTPSVKVFEKYVREMEETDDSALDGINFRDKSEGWSGYALLHRFRSGKSVSVHHGRSKYMRLFLSRICQNVSCAECHYRKLPRIADITLGDYWGISKYHPEMNDNKGTSVVMLNTAHGGELFDSVADKVVQCDSEVEYAIAGNPCIVRSSTPHPKRAEFFANLDKYTLDQLIKMYCPFPSPLKRVYTRVRGMLGRVKRKVVG